jgi:plastocyanin domain-containing protein
VTAKIIVTAVGLGLVALINWYFLVSSRRPRKR